MENTDWLKYNRTENVIQPTDSNQKLVLHSYRRCPFAIRVRMTLEEKQLEYEVIEERLSSLSPELLKLHPQGKVPLLIHGSSVIYESCIITEYLEEAFPEHPLMPSSASEKAQVRLWTFWCNTFFKPDVDRYKYQWNKISSAEKEELTKRLEDSISRFESSLSQHSFLLNHRLTLADIHVFPFVRQLLRAEVRIPSIHENTVVNSWLARITTRSSFERTMRKKNVTTSS